AVFPGEQGSPHHNSIAAIAVAMKIAATDKFRTLQERIVRNAGRLAERLQSHGLHVPFGGSQTHLLLVDCKSIRVDGVPLTGDMAARILDLAGIVVNRNNIPGDRSALNPFGIRIGTVWATQRGFGDAEIDQLGDAIALLLNGTTPFYYRGAGKELRAKVDPQALAEARAIVAQLTGNQPIASDSSRSSIRIRGSKAARFLNEALASNALMLAEGEAQASHVFGRNINAPATLENQGNHYLLHLEDADTAAKVAQWLADLSDAYIHVGDLHVRTVGPVAVTLVSAENPTLSAENGIAASKPYFVGQEQVTGEALPEFVWQAPPSELKVTGLHATHKALGAKMVDFGGYDMPVWYTSVSEEHEAVRATAGLFDVSHMGSIDVMGAGSAEFLNTVTSNDVYALRVGQSHYTYLLDPNGRVIDDLLIYRMADRYLLVVNASNFDEDWAWLNAVNNGEARISNEKPWIKVQQPVEIRDLRAASSGADQRVDIALQGPTSTKTLQAMADAANAKKIGALKWSRLTRCEVAGIDIILSRTGYTGERAAYEIFVHPDNLIALWNAILAAGEPFGVKPCGLAARDSTRTEAGLPLHGHELAGPLEINPLEAGFGKYLKAHKSFFIGRTAFIAKMLNFKRVLVRFQMNDKGVRRPEQGDPIIDRRGKVVGTVTSCAINREGILMGLALVPLTMRKTGTTLQIYQTGGGKRALRLPKKVGLGARMPMPNAATVVGRFPK
ncbi:MAG: glycine cleavage system aminomethyltransferase GcvT, partial [Candidatus Promineifilaceae bacterium]